MMLLLDFAVVVENRSGGKKPTATTPITIRTESTSRSVIIITRQLQSLVTVRELTSIENRQKVGLAIGWIGWMQTCHLSYHMINSDRKSQCYNSKYTILSHNVLMVVKTLRSK